MEGDFGWLEGQLEKTVCAEGGAQTTQAQFNWGSRFLRHRACGLQALLKVGTHRHDAQSPCSAAELAEKQHVQRECGF